MGKLQKTISKKKLIFIIITIILIMLNIILVTRENIKKKQEAQKTTEEQSTVSSNNSKKTVKKPQTHDEIVEYLSNLNERDRIQYYCGQYITHLKCSEYEAAYDLLYPEFKEKYFPTIDDFEKYVKDFYPELFALVYDDITRHGEIYVIRLKIIDAIHPENNQQETIQRIVIKENDYNDFVLSFQVDETDDSMQDKENPEEQAEQQGEVNTTEQIEQQDD